MTVLSQIERMDGCKKAIQDLLISNPDQQTGGVFLGGLPPRRDTPEWLQEQWEGAIKDKKYWEIVYPERSFAIVWSDEKGTYAVKKM
jgi:hypothetical protein